MVTESHLDELGHADFLGHQKLAKETHAVMLEEAGLGLASLAKRGFALLMRQVRVDFAGQLFLGEEVSVRLRASRSGARVAFAAEISRDGKIVSRLRYAMALCRADDGMPQRLPPWFAEKFPAAEKIETVATPAIGCVDTHSRSVLPTGSIRFEDGRLWQEVNIIVHRPNAGEEVGFRSSVWLPVPDELVAAIRNA